MATVKNTIKLQDKMTPVLRSIIKALNTTVSTMAGVDKVSNKAFDKMKQDVRQAQAALEQFNNSADDVPKKAEKGAAAFAKWKNPLVTASALIYTIKNTLSGLSSGIKFVDDFTMSYTRLGLVNDQFNNGLYTSATLQDKILRSANRSRAEYSAVANSVGKLGLLARDAFKNQDEIIAFTEILNKAFKVGGTGAQEASSAMYQLTQAMGSGKLQGDEFRSIMENAPMLADAIAKYMGKTKGKLKELAAEGLITADIVKGALFQAAGDIEEKFQKLPKTWGDVGTVIKNTSTEMFQPVIEKIASIANSPQFEAFQSKIIAFIQQVADWALQAIDFIGQVASWVGQYKDIIVGAIYAIISAVLAYKIIALATAIQTGIAWAMANWPLLLMIAIIAGVVFAWNTLGNAGKVLVAIIGAIIAIVTIWIVVQKILNGVLIANPIGLIIMAIGLLIGIIIAVILWITDLWQTNMDFKYGVIKIWNDILGFFDKIPLFFMKIGYGIADAFSYAKVGTLQIMENMANGVIDIINDLIGLLNKIPGVSIDPLNHLSFAAAAAAKEEAKRQARDNKLAAKEADIAAKAAERDAKMAADRAKDEAALAEKRAKAEAEKQAQAKREQDLYGMNDPFDWNNLNKNMNKNMNITGGKLDSVGKINDEVEITDEDLKYLKDVAATEFVNKYTTLRPEMTVQFGDVRETADVNKILEVIEEMVEEAYASALVGEGA